MNLPALSRRGLLSLGIAAAAVALLGAWKVRALLRDPDVFLLLSESGAEWIRPPVPFHMGLRRLGERTASFRTTFDVTTPPGTAVLYYRAFRLASVSLDGEEIARDERTLDEWKSPREIDLAPHLTPGSHELTIEVSNRNGHPLLLAYCDALDLRTGPRWEASTGAPDTGRVNWSPASPADELGGPAPLSVEFPSASEALASRWYVFAPIFLVVVLWVVRRGRRGADRCRSLVPAAGHVRWALLGLWVLMCLNNTLKLPVHVGFDVLGHVQYIDFIARKGRLPLAPEGWEMFQAPLYYLLAAGPYLFLLKFFALDTVILLLRLLSMACGIAQLELVYRALRHVYRDREDLQVLGLVVGGLLPVTIYLCQGIGNEPLHGLLSAAVILLVMRILHRDGETPRRDFVKLGLLLGLALLAKVTAILLIPLAGGAVAYAHWVKGGRRLRKSAAALGTVFGLALLVAGWYYLRNVIGLGKPFTVGWDPSLGVVWWQDPGYRTLDHVTSFGLALESPINAGILSFWDAVYSTLWTDGLLSSMINMASIPPWNYSFMLAGAWLALLPTAAMLIGAAASLKRRNRRSAPGLLFSTICLGLYLAAMCHLFVTLPFSCTGKASYTVGLAPCYAVLAAGGFDLLTRHRFLRALVYGGVACWATAAASAYFIW